MAPLGLEGALERRRGRGFSSETLCACLGRKHGHDTLRQGSLALVTQERALFWTLALAVVLQG